jgi:transcriptional regulator with XRE-family HTH domain
VNTGRSNLDIAWRLNATLVALKMTQADLARQCGFDPPRVNNWLKANARPDIDAAHTICDHLPITLDWIYRGDATKLPGDLQSKLAAVSKVASIVQQRRKDNPSIQPS